MPPSRYSFGSRVIVQLLDNKGELPGTIIGGPVFRGGIRSGIALWKVQHEEFENWYPADRLRPAI